MKKMYLFTKGVIVHILSSAVLSSRRRLVFWSLLAAFTLIFPLLCGSEAAAAPREKSQHSAQKDAAQSNAPGKSLKHSKTPPSSAAKASTGKPAANTSRKRSLSSKAAKGKASRKRLYVRSMLPAEEKSALRERGISSGFGPRAASAKGRRVRLHKGIDVHAPTGSHVLAFNDGEVIFAGRDGSYGISIVVLQADGRKARYAHMRTLLASQGETVTRGQKIGLSGRTGRTTGPHLHFELVENDEHIDPSLHVWDSTELVLLPGEIYIHDLHDDEHWAATMAPSDTTFTVQ